jgi:hypothetical protein
VRRPVVFCLLGAIALLQLSACGSSGPSAEEQAGDAAAKAVGTEDIELFCTRLVSDRFLDELVDGDVKACKKSTLAGEDPGVPTVTEVAIDDGDARATAMIEIEGGESDGTAGHVELVRQRERWVLDRYRDDYLRSAFLTAIENVDEGAIALPRMKTCMGRQAVKLGPDRIRRIVYDATTDPAAMVKDLLPLAENCRGALAEYGAKAIADALEEEGKRSPAFIRCIRDELETGLLITNIAPELLGPNPDFGASLALDGLATAAKRTCTSGGD